MSKVRLTREQSRDQTRQRLLDAAQSIFITKGFVAASVEDIAEQAGYTRGAFYSNFGSKSELLLQLLRRDHEHVMAEMRAIFEQEGASRAQMEESVLRHYSTHYRENDCFLLWMEAKLQAARDSQFRVGFNACLRELREVVAEYVRQFSEHVGTPLPMAPENWRWASWPCPTACSSATLLIRRRSPTKSPRPCWRRSSAASSSANLRQNKHAARRSAGGRATQVARRLD